MYKILLCGILLLTGCDHISRLPMGAKTMIIRGQVGETQPENHEEDRVSLPGKGTVVTTSEGVPMKLVIAETVTLFDSPQGAANGKELNIFDMVYVHEIKDQDSTADERWMKVSFTRVAGSELGWINVDGKNAFTWVHRIGFRPMRMRKSLLIQLPIYESFEDCRDSFEGKDVSPIGTFELPKQEDRRVAHNPWPILEKKDFTVEGSSVSGYKVCMIGQMPKPGGKTKTTVWGYSSHEIATMRKELRSFDVLVVMDTTGSMGKWMAAAQNAVKNFVNTFDQEGIDARFSLSTFRDVEDGDEMYKNYPFEKANEFCHRLGSLKADAGGDDPEAGYNAFIETFRQSQFRNRSERILLLVGDAPFHTSGSSNPKRYKNSDVVSAARKANTQIFVLAVADATELADQVAPIASGTNGKTFTLHTTQSLIGEISLILSQGALAIKETANVYDALVRGDSESTIAASMGKKVNEITSVIRILRDVKGIDPAKLAAGESVAVTGWIAPAHGGVSSGVLEVFLFRVESEEILKVMQEILRMNPDTTIGPRIWQSAQEERLQNEPIGIFFKENVLPYRSTSILSFSLKDIQGMSEANRTRIQDEVFPLIRKLDTEIKEDSRWIWLDDGRIRGWISESCLP
jgi:hypothetical protein